MSFFSKHPPLIVDPHSQRDRELQRLAEVLAEAERIIENKRKNNELEANRVSWKKKLPRYTREALAVARQRGWDPED